MKYLIIIMAMLFASTACSANSNNSTDDKSKGLVTVVYSTNLHCDKCKKKIESNIAFEKGVKDLQVNVKEKTVTVTYKKDKTDSEKILKAIQKLGYTALIKEETEAK